MLSKLVLVVSILVSGFAAHSQQQSSEVEFPSLENSWIPEGVFISPWAVSTVQIGLSKDQVRSLISYPHFNEGIFGVREWNYVFNFRTGNGAEYEQCQFMVRFDEQYLVKATYWNKSSCLKYLPK